MRIKAIFRGGSFIPYLRHNNAIAAAFKDGDHVYIEIQRERSTASHKHQFAWIRDAFDSLPDDVHGRELWKRPSHLRKHALIMTGHCDATHIVVGSDTAAHEVRNVIKADKDKLHGYSMVTASGPTISILTPHSQSQAAMGAETFQKSKTDILNWIADLLQTNPKDLEKGTQND